MSSLLGVIHMDALPTQGAVFFHMHPHQIVIRLWIVTFAHRVEREVGYPVILAFFPGMDMATEHDVGIPLLELVEQEVVLLVTAILDFKYPGKTSRVRILENILESRVGIFL